MNWDQIEGKWKQMKGSVKQQWGKLTDDDLDVIAGNKDQLVGKIQERYGISQEKAEEELNNWNAVNPDSNDMTREQQRKAS